jgi:hypothetical protein
MGLVIRHIVLLIFVSTVPVMHVGSGKKPRSQGQTCAPMLREDVLVRESSPCGGNVQHIFPWTSPALICTTRAQTPGQPQDAGILVSSYSFPYGYQFLSGYPVHTIGCHSLLNLVPLVLLCLLLKAWTPFCLSIISWGRPSLRYFGTSKLLHTALVPLVPCLLLKNAGFHKHLSVYQYFWASNVVGFGAKLLHKYIRLNQSENTAWWLPHEYCATMQIVQSDHC